MPKIATKLRQQVFDRANGCCEYCQTCEAITGQPMHADHVVPSAGDELENLCLACVNCNLSKSDAILARDPVSSEIVRLFNPRQDSWNDHFKWSENGIYIIGHSTIGRATIVRLKMNQERVVRARQIWVAAGKHPPTIVD